MKIRDGFVAREIAGETIVIALGEASKIFNGMIKLNETGRIIWNGLSRGEDEETIIGSILSEYDVDRETVERDFHKFVDTLRGANILE